MPDYDPKSIPILDDIIEDKNDKTAEVHDEIIICDEVIEDDGTLDLFNDVSTDVEVDQAEPAIGSIDKFIQHDDNTDVDASIDDAHDETPGDEVVLEIESDIVDETLSEISSETPDETLNEVVSEIEEKTETSKSALIDYSLEEAPEERIAEILDESPAQTEEAAPVVDLDSLVDDVVTQLMPELKQKLHTLVRQALQEQLPEDILSQLSPASPSENDNS